MRVCPFKILWPKKYFYIFTVNLYDYETKESLAIVILHTISDKPLTNKSITLHKKIPSVPGIRSSMFTFDC